MAASPSASRGFQERLDGAITQARVNSGNFPYTTQQELMLAILVELMDIRLEIHEIRRAAEASDQ